ncbi:hypothetical protein BU075_06400 [Mammaliicoccus vitulinus]|nr:hypothetical protein BU075_06400 [Mammaliicoccus vitulinus]
MARTCSLSLILFPRASALHKIVENILFLYFSDCSFKYTPLCCKTYQTSNIERLYVARLTKQAT